MKDTSKTIIIIGICVMLVGIALMGYRIGGMVKEGVGSEAGFPMLGLFIHLAGVCISLYGYTLKKKE